MRIGFDAKWLLMGPPSGRRVVEGLVRHLQAEAGDDEVHVFLDARGRQAPLPTPVADDRRHYLWAGNNQLANLTVLPHVSDRLGLDVVVYQNFVPPPRAVRHQRVAFVYDAIFETRPADFTWRERLYLSPLRALTSTADRVCTISTAERARLIRHRYAETTNIDIVPLGVDETFVAWDQLPDSLLASVRARIGHTRPFVLYAGRINARKNVGALVRAFSHVATSDLALVIAGRADATAEPLGALTDSLGLSGRITFLDGVDDDELRALYATAALFVYPSLDEGFGLCPLEAMACGTPTIVSDIAVLREVCGDAARYVDTREPGALASAIDDLMADADSRRIMRSRGLARAATFTWSGAARALLASARAALAQ